MKVQATAMAKSLLSLLRQKLSGHFDTLNVESSRPTAEVAAGEDESRDAAESATSVSL